MNASKKDRKIAVIGNPGSWSTEKLADALEKKTGFRCVVDISSVIFDINHKTLFYQGLDLATLDGLAIKKIGPVYSPDMYNRLEILRFFCSLQIPVFSRPEMIMQAVNRLSCTVNLQIGSIPMPPTVVTEDIDLACDTVRRFRKAVFKPLFSSKARGMLVVEEGDQCRSAISEFQAAGNRTMYIQKMVSIPGKDLGLAFLGGEYIGTYARRKGDSWNTCTSSGGRYERCEPDPEIISLAHRAQDLFNLDFTCVDVVETDQGAMVFEVSAFGGFKGLYQAWGIDAADMYADYILNNLQYRS
ncbi:GAK system ATP-grasp enzyme [Desulfonatronospira sp.]|uniref:GAK system ATP-grasp enzyme n=1 Tax=Desulfonatronospira sp. TaxID=1962951 RepID=UPI0025C0577B|nr:GAK system ATP-grasp enzyme [Desulfonatronospira sp.]